MKRMGESQVTIDAFCRGLAERRGLTNAQRAVAILMWHNDRTPGAELSAAALADTIRDHALGNPNTNALRIAIRKLRVTIAGTKGGFRLRADSSKRIRGWLGDQSSALDVVPSPRAGGASQSARVAKRSGSVKKGPNGRRAARDREPALFIGSSVEGLEIGRALHRELEHDCEPTLWDKGIFGANRAPLHSLLDVSRKADFAVVVFTPDDVVTKKRKRLPAARDNCIFELGLFMGALGPDRCFFIHKSGIAIGLPSDLAGLTTLTYPDRTDGNVRAAIQTACDEIRDAIRTHGVRARTEA